MIEKRKPALLLTIGAAIALIAGGGVAYWLTSRRVSISEMPVGADVLPQNALMTVSFSTNEGQWRRLRQFGTPETQAAFAQELAKLRDRYLTANGLDYEEDIQPWVGDEITAAVLPPNDRPASSDPITAPDPQSIVMVLPIANAARAQQLLTAQATAQSATVQDYQGAQIRTLKGEGDQTFASTVLNQRLLVVSENARAVEQVIDSAKGEAAIAKTEGYSQALSQIDAPQPFARVYVNVPAVRELAAENSAQAIPDRGFTPLQHNQGIAGAVTLEPEGVRFQGVGWLSNDSETRYRVLNSADRMPSLLPANALMMTSGGNLRQLWQEYSQREEASSGTFSPARLRQGILSTTGLDLDEDLMAWMNGEFALALLPIEGAGTAQSAGAVLLVQASDRRAADAALTKLDEVMSSRYSFRVNAGEVEGAQVVTWESPFASLSVTRGWLDGNVAFLALGSALTDDLIPAPDQPLAEDPGYQAAIVSELDPNNGHFFVNLDRLTQTGTPLPLPLPPQTARWMEAIRTIGVTAAIQDERSSRYDVLVQLDKADAPVPLPESGATIAPPTPPAPASPTAPATPQPSPSP